MLKIDGSHRQNIIYWTPFEGGRCDVELVGKHFVIFVLGGCMRVDSNNITYHLSAPAMINMQGDKDTRVTSATDDAEGYVFIISDKFRTGPRMPWLHEMRMMLHPVINFTDAELPGLLRCLDIFKTYWTDRDAVSFRVERINAACVLLTTEVANIFEKRNRAPGGQKDGFAAIPASHRLICSKFYEALTESVCRHHDVKWYADSIGVSVQHLARVTKSVAGLTPKDCIDHLLIAKIKEFIAETTLTFNEISYITGFDDGDSLGRYFSRNVGMTPSEYRKLLNE